MGSPSRVRGGRVPHTSGGGVYSPLLVGLLRPASRFPPPAPFIFLLANVLRQGWLCATSSPSTTRGKPVTCSSPVTKGGRRVPSLGVAAIDLCVGVSRRSGDAWEARRRCNRILGIVETSRGERRRLFRKGKGTVDV